MTKLTIYDFELDNCQSDELEWSIDNRFNEKTLAAFLKKLTDKEYTKVLCKLQNEKQIGIWIDWWTCARTLLEMYNTKEEFLEKLEDWGI